MAAGREVMSKDRTWEEAIFDRSHAFQKIDEPDVFVISEKQRMREKRHHFLGFN